METSPLYMHTVGLQLAESDKPLLEDQAGLVSRDVVDFFPLAQALYLTRLYVLTLCLSRTFY